MGARQQPYLAADGPDIGQAPSINTLFLIEEVASYFIPDLGLESGDYIFFGE